MKLAPVIVLLALIIVPTGIQVSYVVYQLLTKGTKGIKSLFEPSLKLQQFRSRHKRLFYTLISSYFVLISAVLNWAFYQVLAPYLSVDTVGLIWVGSLMLVEMVVIVYSGMRRTRHVMKKAGTLEPNTSVDGIRKWKLKAYNANADNYLKSLVPTLLITMGIFIIWMVLLWLYTMAV